MSNLTKLQQMFGVAVGVPCGVPSGAEPALGNLDIRGHTSLRRIGPFRYRAQLHWHKSCSPAPCATRCARRIPSCPYAGLISRASRMQPPRSPRHPPRAGAPLPPDDGRSGVRAPPLRPASRRRRPLAAGRRAGRRVGRHIRKSAI